MVVQGSKRPRQKQPALLKGLGNIIGSLLPYSIDQSRLRSTEIQEEGTEMSSLGGEMSKNSGPSLMCQNDVLAKRHFLINFLVYVCNLLIEQTVRVQTNQFFPLH